MQVNIMGWSTEMPTEPGWYWAYDERMKDEDELPEIVYCPPYALSDGKCWRATEPRPINITGFSHWLGPLTIPRLPK